MLSDHNMYCVQIHLHVHVHVNTELPHVFSKQDAGSSGIIVYQFHGPLCFVNISVFQKILKLAVHVENSLEEAEGDGCLKTLAIKVTTVYDMYCTVYKMQMHDRSEISSAHFQMCTANSYCMCCASYMCTGTCRQKFGIMY